MAELRGVRRVTLARPVRVAGLLKGQVHWQPDAFAPMTGEELAEFEGAPIFPSADPVVKLLLDTCAFIWFTSDSGTSPRLSDVHRIRTRRMTFT